jgi:type IV secretory pathway VirB10-like protein
LFVLVLAIAIASGFGAWWQARVLRSQTVRTAELGRENIAQRKRIQELNAAQTSKTAPLPPAPVPRLPPAAPPAAVEALAAAEQRARRLHESLDQSKADVVRLEALNSDLQSRAETDTQENRRLSVALEQAKKALADAEQTIENSQAELKSNLDRIAQLESANARPKEGAAPGRQSAGQLSQSLSDIEEVFRRREMYLSNILRRYREITEQYRALSGVMDSRRDRESTPVSGAEISRIQNAIALSEEDMKQVGALSAQAQRLEKKLSAK